MRISMPAMSDTIGPMLSVMVMRTSLRMTAPRRGVRQQVTYPPLWPTMPAMLIRDILNLKDATIYTIAPSGTLAAAVELMVRHDIGSLVVTDAGKMIGMLTFR